MWQYILGLISGITAASIGAYVTVWLERRTETRKDTNVFGSFQEELIVNLEMLSANSVELEKEVKISDEDQHLLTSLTPYHFATWDLLKTRLPKELAGKDVMRKLSLVMHFVLLVNGEMAAREQFKINGASSMNFGEMLKKRDQLLLERNEQLLSRVLELRDALHLKIYFSSPSKSLTKIAEQFQ